MPNCRSDGGPYQHGVGVFEGGGRERRRRVGRSPSSRGRERTVKSLTVLDLGGGTVSTRELRLDEAALPSARRIALSIPRQPVAWQGLLPQLRATASRVRPRRQPGRRGPCSDRQGRHPHRRRHLRRPACRSDRRRRVRTFDLFDPRNDAPRRRSAGATSTSTSAPCGREEEAPARSPARPGRGDRTGSGSAT